MSSIHTEFSYILSSATGKLRLVTLVGFTYEHFWCYLTPKAVFLALIRLKVTNNDL